MGQNKWAIFADDRKAYSYCALLSTLRKCITDFCCILVAKLSSRLIILASEKNINPGWTLLRLPPLPYLHLNVAVCKTQSKNRMYAHIMAKLHLPRSNFWLINFYIAKSQFAQLKCTMLGATGCDLFSQIQALTLNEKTSQFLFYSLNVFEWINLGSRGPQEAGLVARVLTLNLKSLILGWRLNLGPRV